MGYKKRGLSPVIATAFLILLVMTLAVIIFFWMRGFVTEEIMKSSGGVVKSADQVCQDMDYVAQITTTPAGAPIIAVENRQNTPISSFELESKLNGNSNKTRLSQLAVGPGESAEFTFSKSYPAGTKLTLYPVLLGTVKGKNTNKFVTCVNKGTVLQN